MSNLVVNKEMEINNVFDYQFTADVISNGKLVKSSFEGFPITKEQIQKMWECTKEVVNDLYDACVTEEDYPIFQKVYDKYHKLYLQSK